MTEAMEALKEMPSPELCEWAELTVGKWVTKHHKTIRAALQNAEKVDNAVRIKILQEMGFNHQMTFDEQIPLEHIITSDQDKGLFINHTNLMCAMQRIPIVCRLLGRAKERSKAQGLVKALEKICDVKEDLNCLSDADRCKALAREALQSFNEREGG